MEILRAENQRRMPWKNGGGVTVEIAIHPQGAPVDAFDWRVSMASVANDGPFSVFSGIDRTLSVLEGDGIVLDVEGEAHILTRETAPFSFAADARSAARLTGSAITDLNVMTRRGRFTHRVERLTGTETTRVAPAGSTTLIFCAEGRFALDTDRTDRGIAHLDRCDCASIAENSARSLHIKGEGTVFLITITPV